MSGLVSGLRLVLVGWLGALKPWHTSGGLKELRRRKNEEQEGKIRNRGRRRSRKERVSKEQEKK